jgi:plasmid stabilization system protein ParE
MKVWFTPRARSDLEAIIEYLSGQNLQAARNIKRTLDATVSVIGHFPKSGRLVGEGGVRVLPVGRYPYLVYWAVEAGDVWIVHIRDGRRKPWRQDT